VLLRTRLKTYQYILVLSLLSFCLLLSLAFLAYIEYPLLLSIDTFVSKFLSTQSEFLYGSVFLSLLFGRLNISILSFLLIFYLWFFKKYSEIFFFLSVMISTSIGIFFIKNLLLIERPLSFLIHAQGYAFPSGHAALSLSFVGALIFMLSKQGFSRLEQIFMIFLILLAVSAGLSRVLLGVHRFSEVIGGILLSFSSLLLTLYLFLKAKYKRK
jgi:undecaprenyl-diphosphatase